MPTDLYIVVRALGKTHRLIRIVRHTYHFPNETRVEMAKRVWETAAPFALSFPVWTESTIQASHCRMD